jgi:hypothetical protein
MCVMKMKPRLVSFGKLDQNVLVRVMEPLICRLIHCS